MIQIKESFYNKAEVLAIWAISNFQTGTVEDEEGQVGTRFYFNNRSYEYSPTQTYAVITATFGCIALSETEKDMVLSQF